MRPQGTSQQLEKRRRYAVKLIKSKKSFSAAARAVSASVSSAHRWWQAYRKHGIKGLSSRPVKGRNPKLSKPEQEELLQLLSKGSLAFGYKTDLWTLKRICKLIKKQFGVSYHPGHVWKILINLNWSWQKPEPKALQRDERAIEYWKRYKWPTIKKSL